MKLIAESGSTKTDWRCIYNNSEISAHATIGYNPYFMNENEIATDMKSHLRLDFNTITEVYFYGAGCGEIVQQNSVKNALKIVFQNAKIFVDSDMLAAARAMCGRKRGIAAILGTGSNACYYDGEQIQDQSTSLGFILGDEGGGSYIGKKLIQSYFYRQMPDELSSSFQLKYNVSKEDLLDAVYRKPRPNAYLAHYTRFAAEFQQHPFIKKLIENCFQDFFENHINTYKKYANVNLHFTGSIAVVFSSNLKNVAIQYGYEFVDILASPIENLVKYHNS